MEETKTYFDPSLRRLVIEMRPGMDLGQTVERYRRDERGRARGIALRYRSTAAALAV